MTATISNSISRDAVNRAIPDADSFMALMYHNIRPDGEPYPGLSPSASSYFVSRSAFAEQLAELSACGGRCMTWEAFRAFYRAGGNERTARARRPYSALLTFDDGWKDAVDVGGPLLEQFHCQAIMFITTDFLGRPNFLSRSELSRMNAGVFRIGSHARTHRMLSLLGEADIRGELSDSKKLLEDSVGYEIDTLSIPSGAVDWRVRRIASECGYRFVFDSEVRINRGGGDPTAIGRVAIMGSTPLPTFRSYVQQRIARERLRRAALQAPKRVLGLPRYEKLRRWLLGEKSGQQVTHPS